MTGVGKLLMRLNAYENLLTTFMKKLSVVVHYMTRQQQWIMKNGLKKMTDFLSLVIMVFSVFMTGLLLGQSSKK